jgi:hypothetical protein
MGPVIGRFAVLPACLLVAACGATATTSGPPPTGPPPAAAGCVDSATAHQIWTGINSRLNAIVLDPRHQGLADVATGSALTGLQDYIQTKLVANNLTEREVDSLDGLRIDDAGCAGGPVQLYITTTATRDDYLKPDGSVDHSDPLVGAQLHVEESFDRVGGQWKESSIVDLDAPSPSAQIV